MRSTGDVELARDGDRAREVRRVGPVAEAHGVLGAVDEQARRGAVGRGHER